MGLTIRENREDMGLTVPEKREDMGLTVPEKREDMGLTIKASTNTSKVLFSKLLTLQIAFINSSVSLNNMCVSNHNRLV